MKKHGFTLIELIVVIAIIGVLAAILVPAMLGYVRRSKITTANSTSKSIYNAANVAMVEMEAYDLPPQKLQGQIDATGAQIKADAKFSYSHGVNYSKQDLQKILHAKICEYFTEVGSVSEVSMYLKGYGCVAVGVMQGSYPGCYPQKIEPEDFDEVDKWDSKVALGYATKDMPDITPVEGGND